MGTQSERDERQNFHFKRVKSFNKLHDINSFYFKKL